jgi:hypothetical protein
METRNEEQKMAAWIGTVFGILGAMLVALNNGMQDFGYICFTIGSIFSLTSAVKMRDNANIILWLVFLIINIFGLFSYVK